MVAPRRPRAPVAAGRISEINSAAARKRNTKKAGKMRRIDGTADLEEASRRLIEIEPRFETAVEKGGPPPLRRRPGGFAALLTILTEQQVSVASARAIWARVDAAGATTSKAVLAMTSEELCACGLSRPKARYAHAIAAAEASGALCFDRVARADDAVAMAELMAVTGVGRWTAEVYLMFCEGRPDLFPAGDVALQEAARALFALEARPKPKEFDALAEAWSPWRAVAARMLWAYYRWLKGLEGKA